MSSDTLANGWAKALGGDRKQFDMFFDRMMDAFAYHRIIVDKAGKPVDYVFLEINHAFEKMTGLKRRQIIGKKVKEVLLGIENDPADWIGVYGKVALTGEPIQFENHAEPLGKWYRVSAYCPEKGYFVALFEDITKRKKAEEALKDSEENYRHLLQYAPTAIYEIDYNGPRFKSVNDAMVQMTGYSREELLSMNPNDLLNAESRVRFQERIKKVLVGEKIDDNVEFRTVVKGGRELWVILNVKPTFKDGKLDGALVVGYDITERKKAEEALRKLNRHLKAVSDSNQALMHVAEESKFTQEVCNIIVNDCGYALVWVGFAEHDLPKTVRPVAFAGFDAGYIDALYIVWDENSTRGRGPTGTVIRTGRPYICKNMEIDPNFEPWRVEALKRGYTASLVLPLTTMEGETFGALNIYSKESDPFTDEEVKLLTELSNDFSYGIGMLRLRKIREQAEETLRKQASLIDLSPDAIIVRQPQGVIRFWSMGAEKLYGWTKEEAIGQDINTLLKAELPQQLDTILDKVKLNGKWSGEIVYTRKDSNKLVMQSYWLAQFDKNGKLVELLESNVDVTERIRLQTKLEESAVLLEEYANQMEALANQRAEQLKSAERLATIGATAGMVGHDIRNPLQAITGDIFIAKSELATTPESQEKNNIAESLTEIEKNVDYINKIVSDLQDYTRTLRPVARETSIQKLIDELIAKNGAQDNVTVQVDIQKEATTIMADPDILKRIFGNLVTNAVQAMPKGGKLTIKAYKEANDSIITVADTGVGIPEEAKDKIFTPLFTTKSKGQGFGLPVVKRMTEALGGTVTFESQQGKGTKFIVRLPIQIDNKQSS